MMMMMKMKMLLRERDTQREAVIWLTVWLAGCVCSIIAISIVSFIFRADMSTPPEVLITRTGQDRPDG